MNTTTDNRTTYLPQPPTGYVMVSNPEASATAQLMTMPNPRTAAIDVSSRRRGVDQPLTESTHFYRLEGDRWVWDCTSLNDGPAPIPTEAFDAAARFLAMATQREVIR